MLFISSKFKFQKLVKMEVGSTIFSISVRTIYEQFCFMNVY